MFAEGRHIFDSTGSFSCKVLSLFGVIMAVKISQVRIRDSSIKLPGILLNCYNNNKLLGINI